MSFIEKKRERKEEKRAEKETIYLNNKLKLIEKQK
jgi:hypothetical protein